MAADLLAKVRSDCNVVLVEDNTLGEAFDTYDPPDGDVASRKRGSDPEPGWALRYLSAEVKPPSDDVYDYLDNGGSGVDIYVFDSGISHLDEFKYTGDDGQVVDRVVDELDMSDEFTFVDISNHGTRVATAIGGKTRGIARKATLRSVKFSTKGKPNATNFAKALEEITRKHNLRSTDPAFRGSVCNFSDSMGRLDACG